VEIVQNTIHIAQKSPTPKLSVTFLLENKIDGLPMALSQRRIVVFVLCGLALWAFILFILQKSFSSVASSDSSMEIVLQEKRVLEKEVRSLRKVCGFFSIFDRESPEQHSQGRVRFFFVGSR
jgi:hypothetical protein